MLHVGIDEAGYGPLLGPLVIGLVALRLPDDLPPESLLRHLRGLVVRHPRSLPSGPLPVVVHDSKVVHQRFGLAGLGRGVRALACAVGNSPPCHLADVLEHYSDVPADRFRARPWYATPEAACLPNDRAPADLNTRLARRGVEAVALRVRPVDAPALNAAFERHGNKAQVLGLAAGDTLLALLEAVPDKSVQVVFDRHGGRLDYSAYLADLFPFAHVAARPAPPGEARYRVGVGGRTLDVRFVTKGDRASLAVGWASMAAKCVRELFMERMNAWFRTRRPALRPTAGYPQDGRRFLQDVEDLLAEEGVDTHDLVRSR